MVLDYSRWYRLDDPGAFDADGSGALFSFPVSDLFRYPLHFSTVRFLLHALLSYRFAAGEPSGLTFSGVAALARAR